MATTAAVASLLEFGILSAVRCSSVAKQDGCKSSLAAMWSPSSAAGIPFVGGRAAISVPQEFVLAHNRRGLAHTQASIIAVASLVQDGEETEKAEPVPEVKIDQHSDPDSTIVELSFGDRLGALLDTTKALKNLGLNVVKAQVTTDETSQAKNKFYITRSDTGNKVENPELLEAIRLTVINNLLKYHPESSEQLYMGETFGLTPPKVKLDVDVATHIGVKKVNPKLSVLSVETADRPGLLMDIVKVVSDVSVMIESAEINTEGLVAKDQFYVSYGGEALSKSLEQVLTNCLRYHIRKFDSEEESY